MSQPTPNAHDYLHDHLYNELRYLLCAATEWLVQETIPDPSAGGDHVQVYAMDSAALHARALFEFFTQSTRQNHIGIDLFGLQQLSSPSYGNRRSNPALGCWSSPLHSHLMHLQDRTVGYQLTSFDGTTMKDLNKMPVDFAREVVRLWRQFITDLQSQSNPLATLAQTTLNDAIADAARVVVNERNAPHGISPIVW
jgi:hypothetical protein